MQSGFAGLLGWAVGIPEWLNNENSKVNRYWRVIEYGSNATRWPWQGQRIVGLWSNSAGPRGGLINGDLSRFGSSSNQKFVPFFRDRGKGLDAAGRAALYYFLEGGRGRNMELLKVNPAGNGPKAMERGRKNFYFWLMTKATIEQMPFVSGFVQREILAGNYYARAYAIFDPVQVELDMLRQEIGDLLGGLDIKSSKGLREARSMVAMDSVSGMARSGPRKREGRTFAQAYGGAAPLATATATVVVQDFIRDGRGQFSNGAWQDMVRSVNRRVAMQFQQEVVRLMSQERRRVNSGDLVEAHADPQNRYPR